MGQNITKISGVLGFRFQVSGFIGFRFQVLYYDNDVSVHSVYIQNVFYGLCLIVKYILSYLILYPCGGGCFYVYNNWASGHAHSEIIVRIMIMWRKIQYTHQSNAQLYFLILNILCDGSDDRVREHCYQMTNLFCGVNKKERKEERRKKKKRKKERTKTNALTCGKTNKITSFGDALFSNSSAKWRECKIYPTIPY